MNIILWTKLSHALTRAQSYTHAHTYTTCTQSQNYTNSHSLTDTHSITHFTCTRSLAHARIQTHCVKLSRLKEIVNRNTFAVSNKSLTFTSQRWLFLWLNCTLKYAPYSCIHAFHLFWKENIPYSIQHYKNSLQNVTCFKYYLQTDIFMLFPYKFMSKYWLCWL